MDAEVHGTMGGVKLALNPIDVNPSERCSQASKPESPKICQLPHVLFFRDRRSILDLRVREAAGWRGLIRLQHHAHLCAQNPGYAAKHAQ